MNRPELKGTPLPLVDGESVYCLNQRQLEDAQRLVFAGRPEESRLEQDLNRLERDYGRNERAALAFVLIDRLLRGSA